VTVVGGTVPKQRDGWMWGLTVPGNNDHDFYVLPEQPSGYHARLTVAGDVPILVHNTDGCDPSDPQWEGSPKHGATQRGNAAPEPADPREPSTTPSLSGQIQRAESE
jgi:hypothetical protein